MALILDTLVFAQRLRAAGIFQEHAEAHADVARDVVLVNVASRNELNNELARPRSELKAFEETLVNRIVGLVAAIMIGFVTVSAALMALAGARSAGAITLHKDRSDNVGPRSGSDFKDTTGRSEFKADRLSGWGEVEADDAAPRFTPDQRQVSDMIARVAGPEVAASFDVQLWQNLWEMTCSRSTTWSSRSTTTAS